MATTTVSDAIVVPQSKGTGLSSEDDVVDAASAALLSQYAGTGSYIETGMEFTNHDGAGSTVDVASGVCFIKDTSSSTAGSRGSGGNPQVQSTASSGYDTEIPDNQVYCVIFPSSVTVDVNNTELNQIWVNITDVTSNNAVEVRSDGGGGTTTQPSNTFVKVGEADPDSPSSDVRGNDYPSRTFASSASGSVVAQPGEVQSKIDNVAGGKGGKVLLDSSKKYSQPSSPWVVKEDVTLDFNGAFLVGDGSLNGTDFIHLAPGGRLLEPRVDLYDGGNGYTTSNGHTGNVFKLDTDYGPYFAYGTTIRNGQIMAEGGTTTGCKVAVNQEGTWVTHNDLQFDIGYPEGSSTEASVKYGLDLDTTGPNDSIDDGWINGLRVWGNWRYPDTGVLQQGVTGSFNQQVQNLFYIQYQPGSNANAFWQILDPTWSRLNKWRGVVWDFNEFADYAWKIDSTYQDADDPWRGCKRNSADLLDWPSPADNTRNDSPNTHYATRMDNYTTTDIT